MDYSFDKKNNCVFGIKLLFVLIASQCIFKKNIYADVVPLVNETEELVKDHQKLIGEISTQNVASLPPAMPFIGQDFSANPDAFYDFLANSVFNPSQQDKRRRAFRVLGNAERRKIEGKSSVIFPAQAVIDVTVTSDLNLLFGSRENPLRSLQEVLSQGRTHTEMGKAFLAGLLARPTKDTQVLELRQAFIKKLINDESLRNQLDSLLAKIARNEAVLTGLWEVDMLSQMVDMNYSKMEYLGPIFNKSPWYLELMSLVKFSGVGLGASIAAITPVVLGVHALSLMTQGDSSIEGIAKHCMGQIGIVFELYPALKNRWIQSIAALGVGAVSSLMLKHTTAGAGFLLELDSLLKERLNSIASYDHNASTLAMFLIENKVAENNKLLFAQDVVDFFTKKPAENVDLAQFFDLMGEDTFSEESRSDLFFFSRGNVLCAYFLLNKVKDQFEDLLVGIGELDAYLTVAKLVVESTTNSSKWSLVDYSYDQSVPALSLQDFWNPFIPQEIVVKNSLELGAAATTPNIVVTGPNSSGKSTVLKAVALALILGQSLGIAPAQAIKFTPFGKISTYMNVADSLVDKESKFQAEARRVFEYGDKLDLLEQENIFSFAIFDEIFSGTSPAEGAALGFEVAREFSKREKSMSLVATHFELLTELERVTQRKFVNYKIEVALNKDQTPQVGPDGKIVRLYSLVPGISHQQIAKEIFRERGDLLHSNFFGRCFGKKS